MKRYADQQSMQKLAFVSLVVLLSLALAACGSDTSGLAIGDQAPDFTLTNANGQSVSLTDYTNRQKPVLLYFHMAMG
ncbi:MAG: hypothetical protein DWQ07_23790 [Chloroflexi bacterium]|nr:MAG: hypothetical protein DWQ07_23790 [Chloroflexota bacterium]MBL1194170.1 hypothetical protein [Chloroflexota bacterium]NOH11462.1 redoxin domain-containing protein [Chloroflexota bacterium]